MYSQGRCPSCGTPNVDVRTYKPGFFRSRRVYAVTVQQHPELGQGVTHCEFSPYGAQTCTSRDLTIGILQKGDPVFVPCRFAEDIDWGDGSKHTALTTQGFASGSKLLAEHSYTKTGTYSIVMVVKTTVGSCGQGDGHYQFTAIA